MPPVRDRLLFATLLSLFVGYACTYFHRADLPTLAPLWAENGRHAALGRALPDIASLGMLVYGLGKFFGGWLADRCGGRPLFICALAGASLAEFAAALSTTPGTFAACRVAGMAVLALAWPSLGHIVAAVTPRQRLATVMAFLSQSYLLGDATVRALLAAVVKNGGDGPTVLRTSGAALAIAALLVTSVFVLVHRSSQRAGRKPAQAPVVHAPTAWTPLVWLAGMSVTLALVREALSFWSPLWLFEACAVPAEDAVRLSALLPLAGGLGALCAGFVADRGPRWLALLMVAPTLLGAAGLLLLATVGWTVAGATVALATIGCVTAMPQSLVSGVLPLRAGAGRGAARLGFVDGMGTLGAVFAAGGLARVRGTFGMPTAFVVLAGVLVLATVAACGFLATQLATRRRTDHLSLSTPKDHPRP